MKEIIIDFFPVVGTAKLWFEDRLVDPITNAAANCLKNTPIDVWLYPYRRGYHLWRGLLLELMDEVDDDELVITVEGPLTVYQQIQQAFNAQKNETDDMGFRHDAYNLIHKQKREIEDCRRDMAQIYKQCGIFLNISDQEGLFLQNAYEKAFQEADSYGKIYEASSLLVKLLEKQIEACGSDENYESLFTEWRDQIKVVLWGE